MQTVEPQVVLVLMASRIRCHPSRPYSGWVNAQAAADLLFGAGALCRVGAFVCRDITLMPSRPPGLSTRNASARRGIFIGQVDHAVRDDDIGVIVRQGVLAIWPYRNGYW
jgi:hypothetical protein